MSKRVSAKAPTPERTKKMEAEAVLFVSDDANSKFEVYPEEELQKIADKYPDKLEFRDGKLICKVELTDEAHKDRMLVSARFAITQRRLNDRRDWQQAQIGAKCSACIVEETEKGFKLFTMHPQWGGYGGWAEIAFDKTSGDSDCGPGCFELAVYHDGDFPSDEIKFQRHCCDATQFLRFGLDVLEAQMKNQLDSNEAPVGLDDRSQEVLRLYRDRIDKLLK